MPPSSASGAGSAARVSGARVNQRASESSRRFIWVEGKVGTCAAGDPAQGAARLHRLMGGESGAPRDLARQARWHLGWLSGSAQKRNHIMSVWEYKVISSGKGGFASPALLEKFLGELGRDEWEIIHFQSPADNPLAFSGLARRPTQRDWTLEDAVATAAKAEAEKLRAEFAAKFEAATRTAPAAEEKAAASFLE